MLGTAEIFAPLPAIEWTCKGLGIAPGAPICIAGYGYSGKTITAQSLALSVASGRDVWGVFAAKKGLAVHIDHEQGAYLSRERYQRLARGMGIAVEDIDDRLRLAVHPSVYLDSSAAESHYLRAAEGARVVIIDSLRAAAPSVDENSSEVRRHLDMLGRVSERTGATMLIVHHATKPTPERDGKYSLRGSGALFDACASVFVFSAKKGEPTRVNHVKDRIRGLVLDDFGLRVDDVEIDGDPRAGLIVRHLDREQLPDGANDPRVESGIAKATAKIEKFFAVHGPIFRGPANELRAAIGGDRTATFSAVARLKQAGRITERGKRGAIELHWISTPSP